MKAKVERKNLKEVSDDTATEIDMKTSPKDFSAPSSVIGSAVKSSHQEVHEPLQDRVESS